MKKGIGIDANDDVLTDMLESLVESARFAAGDWRSSKLRQVLPRHQLLLAMERRYFTRSPQAVVVVADQVGESGQRAQDVTEGVRAPAGSPQL